ncbi:hypothetical protein BDR04DRAFT_654978 [Suillus decipiens]|nr:hypothetical protein BDR04DRAFT_654978 [Suillus decipiens]
MLFALYTALIRRPATLHLLQDIYFSDTAKSFGRHIAIQIIKSIMVKMLLDYDIALCDDRHDRWL